MSRPGAARQLCQPMHSQFANFIKFKLNSLNLAPFLLLNPVVSNSASATLACFPANNEPDVVINRLLHLSVMNPVAIQD